MRQSNGTITENYEVIFDELIQKMLTRIRVGTLARVIAVNRTNRTVNVQPIVMEKVKTKYSNDSYMILPIIKEVPYILGQNPQVNDYVVCLHLDRTMRGINLLTDTENFIKSNNHRHDLNDCVAIVINTRDSWAFLGEFTETGNFDISEYLEMRVAVVYNDAQIKTETFIINLTDVYKVMLKEDGSEDITLTKSANGVQITGIPSGYKVYIYAR